MKIFNILMLILIVIGFCQCKEVFNDEPFTLEKSDFFGGELRLDGYFYNYYLAGQDSIVRLLIFYKNGIVIRTVSYESLDKFEEMVSNNEFNKSIRDVSFLWGLFNVEDDSLKIEHHYPQGGIGAFTYILSGKILNDTTFQLTNFSCSDGSSFESIDQMYHFKQFKPKPDSTNIWIK